MAGAHTEAVLNKVSKPELVQIILNTEDNLDRRSPNSLLKSKTC